MRPNKSLLALRQAKAANSFYLTRKDCTSILPFHVKLQLVFGNTDISLIFFGDLCFALFCSIFLSTLFHISQHRLNILGSGQTRQKNVGNV